MTVCKFYLKGKCRYGVNCRFEHPGEEYYGSEQNTSISNFSFKSALNELAGGGQANYSFQPQHQPQPQPQPQTHYQSPSTSSFSFARALESQNLTFGNNNLATNNNNIISNSLGFGNSNFVSGNSNFGQGNSSFGFGGNSFFGRSQQPDTQMLDDFSHGINTIKHQVNTSNNIQPQLTSQLQEFSRAELEAFESCKFQFRRIPIRPPPPTLC